MTILQFILSGTMTICLYTFNRRSVIRRCTFLRQRTTRIVREPKQTMNSNDYLYDVFRSSLFRHLREFFAKHAIGIANSSNKRIQYCLLSFIRGRLRTLFTNYLSIIIRVNIRVCGLLSIILFLRCHPNNSAIMKDIPTLSTSDFKLLTRKRVTMFRRYGPINPRRCQTMFTYFLTIITPRARYYMLQRPTF